MLSINPLENTEYARKIFSNVQEQLPEIRFEKQLKDFQTNLVVLVIRFILSRLSLYCYSLTTVNWKTRQSFSSLTLQMRQ